MFGFARVEVKPIVNIHYKIKVIPLYNNNQNKKNMHQKIVSLISKIMLLRVEQKRYFKTRSNDSFIRCQKIEFEVDELLKCFHVPIEVYPGERKEYLSNQIKLLL